MVYALVRIIPGEWYTQISLEFWNKNGSPNLGQTTRPRYSQHTQKKVKRTCRTVDFTVPADYRVKLIESKKKDKYMDLAREPKKLWNIKVTVIPILVGALGTVTKGSVNSLDE